MELLASAIRMRFRPNLMSFGDGAESLVRTKAETSVPETECTWVHLLCRTDAGARKASDQRYPIDNTTFAVFEEKSKTIARKSVLGDIPQM